MRGKVSGLVVYGQAEVFLVPFCSCAGHSCQAPLELKSTDYRLLLIKLSLRFLICGIKAPAMPELHNSVAPAALQLFCARRSVH